MSRPASAWLVVALIAWTAACAEPNQAPFSCGPTPPQTVDAGDSVSFLPCFTDPDADPLTISAEVPHHLGPYVGASAAGGTVTIHGRREHDPLPVTITATDPGGRVSSDPVITTADSFVGGALVWVDMAPGDTGSVAFRFTNHPDPGKLYFGLCGVSQTPEYNLANNCSKGLKVIFPESTAEGVRHSPPSGSHKAIVRRFRTGTSVRRRDDSR